MAKIAEFQYHLDGPDLNGRGVRVRVLDPDERRTLRVQGAMEMPALEGQVSRLVLHELEQSLHLFCAKHCVVEVTELDELETLQKSDVVWHRVTLQELTMPGPYNWSSLFPGKNSEMVSSIYAKHNELGGSGISSVLGKGTPVAG